MKRLLSVSVVSALVLVVLMITLFEQAPFVQANVVQREYDAPQFSEQSSDLRFTTVLTPYAYLPMLFSPQPVIEGHVTQNGAPLIGATVWLESISTCCMHPSGITNTVTDANGNYQFFNIRSSITTTQEVYRAEIHGQLTWFTPAITYTAGSTYTFAPVDTTGIKLLAPADHSTITLPHKFTWKVRPDFPTDSYEVRFFWAPFSWGAGEVGYQASEVVPLSMLQGNQFPYVYWYVQVYSPVGFGETPQRLVYFSWDNTHDATSGEAR